MIAIAEMPEPINLELLARHLQAIRNELREIQYNADNDRRNVRSQFENLVATNANQLGDIEARLAARIDVLETLLGDRFGHLDERITQLDERAVTLEKRMGSLEEKMNSLVVRTSGVERKMTDLETHMARHAERMEHLIALVEKSLQSR